MKKQSETDALSEKIRLLENKQKRELSELKEHAHFVYETLKPINLIKNIFHEIASTSDIKNNIVNNLIGLSTGFLSKKILVRSSHNPVKRILGTLLQFAIANVVSKHSDTIKITGENLLKRFLKYRSQTKREQEFDHHETNL